jgi:hypothetical protein
VEGERTHGCRQSAIRTRDATPKPTTGAGILLLALRPVITAGCAPQPKCLNACAITSALTYASQAEMWKVSTRGPMDVNEFLESEAQTGAAGDELAQRIGHPGYPSSSIVFTSGTKRPTTTLE